MEQKAGNLDEFVRQSRGQIVENVRNDIGRLPSWFNFNSYLEHMLTDAREYVEADSSLSETVAGFDESKEIDLSSLSELLSEILSHLGESAMEDKIANARNFLESDLPVDYFLIINRANNATIDQFATFVTAIASIWKNQRTFRRQTVKMRLEAAKKNMAELAKLSIEAVMLSWQLKFYINLSNATSMDDFFSIQHPKFTKMDGGIFERYLNQLDHQSAELRSQLLRLSDFTTLAPELSPSIVQFRKTMAKVILDQT